MAESDVLPVRKEPDAGEEPRASRPHMPEYGLLDAASGSGLFPWSRVGEKMAAARSYWIITTRPDGRPHAAPVWGVWLGETFYFGTARSSVKGRNLAANPALVVHLESGDDALILEGTAEEIDDPALRARVDAVYAAKYGMAEGEAVGDGTLLYGLRPRVAFAWLESDFVGSATRWTFGSG